MQLKKFKARPSMLGKLMTNAKKGEGMGQTAITYINSWVKEQLYGRRKEIQSKYLAKGIDCEDDAILYASQQLEWGFVLKNDVRYENEYMTGEPDIILPNHKGNKVIKDIKNSWDFDTFPLLKAKLPSKDYDWQMQGYMYLTGASYAGVNYVLMDAPEDIILAEANKQAWKENDGELTTDIYERVKDHMTYSDLPDNLRIKEFIVERDQKKIDLIEPRVIAARHYIDQVLKGLNI